MAKIVCLGEDVNNDRIGLRDAEMIDEKLLRLDGGLGSRRRRTLLRRF